MKYIFLTIFLIGLIKLKSQAQKPELNLEAIKSWTGVIKADITSDGKYGYYILSSGEKRTLIAKSVNGSWEMVIPKGRNPFITTNNKYLICETDKDSIL